MNQDCILTFDQGTTRQKVALFDLQGKLLGQQASRNEDFHDQQYSWQDADAWWQCACDATSRLLAQTGISGSNIIACSISGRAGAGVFLNSLGQVIYQPWLDQRHKKQLLKLQNQFPDLSLYGATLLAKLLWLRAQEPDTYDQIAHALYAKDLLLYRLTGVAATDPASGPDRPVWPADVLATLGVDVSLLPAPLSPTDRPGNVQQAASAQLGIDKVPVIVGAHDGICANIGAGCISAGAFALTLGTHGVTRTLVDETPAPDMLRFYGFPPDKHVIGANAFMAGRSLDWLLDNFSAEEDRALLFKRLDKAVSENAPGANGLMFLPYLAGQISPLRSSRRGSFVGLSLAHGRTEMYQAVLEGASFAIAEAFLQVVGWAGEANKVCVTGSGAKSNVWLQLLANLLDESLIVTDSASEGRGAAILAAVGIGIYNSIDEAITHMVPEGRRVSPEPEKLADYASLFAAWRDLNGAMRDIPGS